MSFLLLLMSSLQQNWRKEQNSFWLETREWGERGWLQGAGRRNDPNDVWTNECMNKEAKILIKK
jgi:hypothetical protein